MDVILRALRADEFDAFCGLLDDLHEYHVEGVPHVFQTPSGHVLDASQFQEIASGPEHFLVGAYNEQKLAGFVWAYIRLRHGSPTHVPRQMLIVEMVEVAKPYRRQGIGHKLMAQASQWGIEHGATEALLDVWSFNQSAISFYQKLGYKADLIQMRLPLSK